MTNRCRQATYEQQFRAKMGEIAQTRAGLAKSMQQQLQNGQPAQMGMAQPQAHMQGMVPNPNQISMQQRLASQQMARPNQQPMVGMPNQQQNMHMGNPQARFQLPNGQPKMPAQGQFSLQDQEQISRLTNHLMTTATPERIQQIRQGLNISHPQQQQHLAAQGMDVLQGYFRELAVKQYMAMRNQSSQRANILAQGPNTVNGDQRPMSQNAMRTQGQQMGNIPAAQNVDPSFMGNVDQIHLQQQNAQRLQEAGQVVVPVSNNQAIAEQQRAAGRPNSQQPNIQTGNRPPQTPNMSQHSQGFWNAQGQQQPTQTAAPPQIQNPPQANGFPTATTPGPAHLQGQVGGLNTPVGRMQHNMPHLNRGAGSQNQTSQPQNMWPQQGTPQIPQASQATTNAHQMSNGAPPRPMNNQQMQQFMQTLPEDERHKFLMQMARQRAAGQQQSGQAQPVRMQPQRSQAGQQLNVTQGPSRPGITAQQANGSQSQRGPGQQPGQPQVQPQQGDLNQAARQRQQQQQQQVAIALNVLTEENERLMDSHPFPPGILNANNALSRLPQAVKTWGHLKAWVRENAGNLPRESEQKLRGLQGLHFQSISQRQQQPGMRPTAPMVPRPSNQTAHAQMPSMTQPTIHEIQQTRAHNPQLHGATDDQVKKAIMKQRFEQIQRARQQQGLNPQEQSQLMQRQQQAQFQQQQQAPALQPGMQATKPAQPTPQRPQNQRPSQQPAQPNQQAAPKAAPQAPMQPNNKGAKRPNTDDVVEVPDPKPAQQKSQTAKPAQQKPNAPSQAAKLQQTQPSPLDAKQQQMQRGQTTHGQQVTQATKGAPAVQKSEEVLRQEARLRELVNEVKQSTVLGQPVPMNAATRGRMVEKLARSVTEMLNRMDRVLPLFFTMFKDEKSTKEMIRAVSTTVPALET